MPKIGGLVLKQPMFNWKSPDKYIELYNFNIEVNNLFLTNRYLIQDGEKV